MDNLFTGKLKCVLSLYEKGTFKKLEFIVMSDEDYPQPIKFEFHNSKCDNLDGFEIGDTVKLNFNIRGREWINHNGDMIHFSSLVAWKIQKIENGYVVPTKDGSNNLQHNFNFPPASEVFFD